MVGGMNKEKEDLREEPRDVSHAPDLLGGPSLSSKGEQDVYTYMQEEHVSLHVQCTLLITMIDFLFKC